MLNNKTEDNTFFAKKVLEEVIPCYVPHYAEKGFKRRLEKSPRQQDKIPGTLVREEYLDPDKKVGFKITNNRFHVCALLDDSYILYDPVNKQYYGFGPDFGHEEGLIGVPVVKECDAISIDVPMLINKYKHPARPSCSNYERIDIGHYELERPRKTDEENFSRAVIRILHDVRNVLTIGYTGMCEWNTFHGNEEYWKDHLLKPEEVDKSKVSNRLSLKL